MRRRGDDDPARDDRDIQAELRRLTWAAVFFAACLVIVGGLALVGLYH
jgi:hypothetical protein